MYRIFATKQNFGLEEFDEIGCDKRKGLSSEELISFVYHPI
ncbi:hypothetical protein [Leptospira ryugenii]|nr:hypothetical protein [Leptospira ryugenii]